MLMGLVLQALVKIIRESSFFISDVSLRVRDNISLPVPDRRSSPTPSIRIIVPDLLVLLSILHLDLALFYVFDLFLVFDLSLEVCHVGCLGCGFDARFGVGAGE